MGYLNRSKGRVTEIDINNANLLIQRMQLTAETKKVAQLALNQGKNSNFLLHDSLQKFYQVTIGHFTLIRMFLEIQISAALADGYLSINELQILHVITEELGINRVQFN